MTERSTGSRRAFGGDLTAPLRRFWSGRRPVAAPTGDLLLDEDLLRTLEQAALAQGTRRPRRIAGNRRSPHRAPAAEFVEHRAYTPGDDLRRVDWHAQARLGAYVVRLGEQPASGLVRLVVDASASMRFGAPNKLRRALQLAVAIGYVALSELDRVSLEPLGLAAESAGTSAVLHGKTRAPALFGAAARVLAAWPADGLTPAEVEQQFADRIAAYRPDEQVILISDLLVPNGYRQGLGALGARGLDARVLHVLSAEDLRPAPGGDCTLIDPETGEQREMTVDGVALRQYQERLGVWLAETRQFLTVRAIPYALIEAEAPIEDVLVTSLRAAGVVA